MKKCLVYISALLVLAVSCTKKDAIDFVNPDPAEQLLKVRFDMGAFSKAIFENDSEGTLSWYSWDEFNIVGIPVETDPATGIQTFHPEKSVLSSRAGGWGGANPSNHVIQYVDKTPFEFYREYDQCVFLMVSSVGIWSEYARFILPGGGSFSQSFEDYAKFLSLQDVASGLYAFRTAVAGEQRTYCVRNPNDYEDEYYNYSSHQTICGYSSILTLDDIAGEDYVVTFKGLKPVNALLMFDIQFDGASSVDMYSMEIRLENSTHMLSGPSFTTLTVPDYAASTPGSYEMASIPFLAQRWNSSVDAFRPYMPAGTALDAYFSNYADCASRIRLTWHGGTSDWEFYHFTLSSTPVDYKFTAVVLPQIDFADENSYLRFEAKDATGTIVAVAEKPLPAGGFQPGKRYDFTLTMAEPTLGTTPGNAGSYGVGTL